MTKRLLSTAVVCVILAAALLDAGCSKSDSSTNPAGAVITVTGKVVNASNLPVAGVPVLIGTLPSVVTDASGNFSIPNVTAPYTITVVDGIQKIGLVYLGLTRSDPTLSFFSIVISSTQTASLSGTVSGGAGFPAPALHSQSAAFVSPEVAASTSVNSATGAYGPYSVNWNGASTTTGTIHALQWQVDGTGFPVTFKGYGSKASVALSNGGTFAGQNVVMSPIVTTSVAGSVTVPAGYTIGTRSVIVSLGTSGGIQILNDGTGTGSFTYNVPNVSGATLRITAQGTKAPSILSSAFRVGVALNATGVAVTVPAAPEYSLPVAAATGVNTTTDFAWTALVNGVHYVIFTGPAGQPRYQVVTTGNTAKIPNLSTVGLALPTSAAYTWAILAIGPFTSIDQAAGTTGLFGGLSGSATADGYLTATGVLGSPRTFTTAP